MFQSRSDTHYHTVYVKHPLRGMIILFSQSVLLTGFKHLLLLEDHQFAFRERLASHTSERDFLLVSLNPGNTLLTTKITSSVTTFASRSGVELSAQPYSTQK